MRKTRISLDVHDVDAELLRLYNMPSGNDRTLKIAKKALVNIIREELSDKQKQYVILYYYKGLNEEQIAKKYLVNKSTVSRTLSRARVNIAKQMKYYIKFSRGFSEEDD